MFACFVDRDRMRSMVFALGAVRVDFLWKLHLNLTGRGGSVEGLGVLLSIILLGQSDLDGSTLANQAFGVLEGKNCNVFLEEGSMSLEVHPNN